MLNNIPIRYKQPLHEDNILIAENNNIPLVIYKSRILNGWTIDEAINVFPMSEELAKNHLKSDDLKFTGNHLKSLEEILKHEESNRRIEYKKKYAKPKPWLDKYPQVTEFGDYAQQLFKDCFGSW